MRTRATATRGTAVPVSGRARANAPMSGRVPVAAWTLISALVLGACGCAASNPTRPASEPPTRSFAAHRVQLSPLDPERQAVELRTGLEELFGQDVFVGVRVTRSRLRGDPDFTQAAVDALSRNSDALTSLIGRVYGSAKAQEFRRLWESQQEGLVAYARAASQHDQAAKAAARGQLDASPGRIAQFLHDLTSGGAAAPAISSRLGTHIDDLIRFTDAYAAGDYATAYRIDGVGGRAEHELLHGRDHQYDDAAVDGRPGPGPSGIRRQ